MSERRNGLSEYEAAVGITEDDKQLVLRACRYYLAAHRDDINPNLRAGARKPLEAFLRILVQQGGTSKEREG